MNVSNVLESFMRTLNSLKKFLEEASGLEWTDICNKTWIKFENVVEEFQESQKYVYKFFKNKGSNALSVLLSTQGLMQYLLTFTLVSLVVFLYACHIAISGIRSRKSTTLFPIATFIIYLVIAPQELSFISSFKNFLESSWLNQKYPSIVELLFAFDVPVMLFSMLVAYLLSGLYSFCKYIVFAYIMASIWNVSIPNSAASSHYLLFFLTSTLLLLAYLKMFHIVEMIFLSILFALTSSLIFIQYLGLIVGKNEVLAFVNGLFSFNVDFNDKLTLIFVILSFLSLSWQYLASSKKDYPHYGFRPDCSA